MIIVFDRLDLIQQIENLDQADKYANKLQKFDIF